MKRAEKYHIIKKLKNSDSLCFQWVSEFLFSPTVKDGIIARISTLFNDLLSLFSDANSKGGTFCSKIYAQSKRHLNFYRMNL